MRLLVIEDDPDLNRQLATALTDAGYVVDRAFDGEEEHYLGETEPYDAIILDIGLPKMDGISVLESWRRAGRAMPVLLLTARDRWSDKVQGFDAGADDYVAKPFHLEEVLARIRALLRQHFLEMKRLCDVIVGAGIEALHLVAPAVARGENQHRHRAPVAAPRFQHRDAVHLGQADIEHDGVIGFTVAEKMPLLAIERAIDHITGIRQRRRELTVEIRIVLNNEQAQAGLQW